MKRTKDNGRRTTTLSVIMAALAVLVLLVPASASALPHYGGLLAFPTISGPSTPEEYSWQVELHPEQELVAVDDQSAVVKFSDGTEMERITAEPAHDATGAGVPTSLAVSGSDVVTLTVHHLAGNPAGGGAPFIYPILSGPPFVVGFSKVEFIAPPAPQYPLSLNLQCHLPNLVGKTLRASKRSLEHAGCGIGLVKGRRGVHPKGNRVIRQNPKPGNELAPDAAVNVALGSR